MARQDPNSVLPVSCLQIWLGQGTQCSALHAIIILLSTPSPAPTLVDRLTSDLSGGKARDQPEVAAYHPRTSLCNIQGVVQ